MELHKNTHHVHCISITLSFSIFYHISGQAFFYILLLLLMFFFILFLLFQLLLFFFFFSQKNLFSPLHFIPISSHPTSPLLFLLCSLPVFFLFFLCHLFFLLFFISHYKKHIDCGWLFFAEVYITTTTLSSCGHLTSPININTMHWNRESITHVTSKIKIRKTKKWDLFISFNVLQNFSYKISFSPVVSYFSSPSKVSPNNFSQYIDRALI